MGQVKVSREFASNFSAVSKYYGCPPDEITVMKQTARNDIENAVISFGLMAKEIEERK